MKIQWLFPSAVGVLCVVAPAQASGVTSWRFDPGQNQLEFRTSEPVQPRAQLVTNPTRLVIDLPGIEMGQAPIDRSFSGNIRQIRIGQFDRQTTRIVLELAPGYTIDPQQIRFRGLSPTQWTVQIPQPMSGSVANSSPAAGANSPGGTFGSTNPAIDPTIDPTLAQIAGLQTTGDGLFIRFKSGTPQVEVERSRDRRTVLVTVENAVLSPELGNREVEIDRFGVERVQFEQVSDRPANRPPAVRIRLAVEPTSQDWQATVSNLGGIVMLPTGNNSTTRQAQRSTVDRETPSQATRIAQRRTSDRSTAAQNSSSLSASRSSLNSSAASGRSIAAQSIPNAAATVASASGSDRMVTIEGVELNPVNNQLLIESDRPIAPTSRWQNGTYQIVLSPARLADRVTGPRLTANSPLIRVRLRQEDSDTVVISLQPATGVRFGSLNLVSPQLLSLEIERSSLPANPAQSSAAALSGNRPPLRPLPPRSSRSQLLPRAADGRIVVAIDPGHGGADVGAVGIGGIQEAGIVLNVSQQVARLLEQQGIQAVMTRSDDREIDLQPRVDIAEQVNATLFVSIHANSLSLDRPDVNGVETYYYSNGAGLAETIQRSILSDLADMDDRGVRQARFYVLRRTTMPAVLVEIGFVTGAEDAPRLANPNWQNQMATAIARGILQYLRTSASR